MTDIPEKEPSPQYIRENPRLIAIIKWLVQAKASAGIRSPHFWIILALMVCLAYIYYGVLSAFHDIYVTLFFYPLMYGAIVYRLRGVTVSGLVILGILIPHTVLFYYDPYSLVRLLLFAVFAFLISSLIATLLNYLERQLAAYEEILSLNEKLNSYIGRLESTQKQLIHAEKLNAIGQLAASVAHELNNPLAGVLVYSKLLSKKIGDGSFQKEEAVANLSKIELAVDHCSKIIRGLLDFAHQSEPKLQPVTINHVIDQVISLVGHQAEMRGIKIIREEIQPLPPVMADFTQLQQVFINLAINAIQAMPDSGTLTISGSLDNDQRVKVAFQDTGHGITPENMEKLFTPFFTTKEVGKGVGLGLAVSHGIVESHGGVIEVQSEAGKGSTFTVILPAHKAELDLNSQHN